MDTVTHDCHQALQAYNGHLLASTISPIPPKRYLNRLESIYSSSRPSTIQTDVSQSLTRTAHRSLSQKDRQIIGTFTEIYVAYWHAVAALVAAQELGDDKANWGNVYEKWKDVVNAVIRGYSTGALDNWTLPLLYLAGRYLRHFAIKADESKKHGEENGSMAVDMGGIQDDIAGDFGKNVKLEDAARVLNRMFTLCISDRAPLEESRKWGLYYIANLLFKTYFKLNSISLSKNIVRAINASTTDMPALDQFPKAHIVTYKYYLGLIRFLEENYTEAEESFTQSLSLCHHTHTHNKSLLLTYLIPTRLLLHRQLPSPALLRPYPHLARLFLPISHAIKSGSLSAFDAALEAGEQAFVKRRIYLTLERGRDICLRNLLRKVYLLCKDDQENQRTRVKIVEFGAGIRLAERKSTATNGEDVDMTGGGAKQEEMEDDEVECLISNQIYKNLMKGYISRQHGMVVLSKAGAFPGTGI